MIIPFPVGVGIQDDVVVDGQTIIGALLMV